MTLTDLAANTTTAEERAERLAAANAAWADRIAARPASAQLTFNVTGRSTGSVATEIVAGRHRFLVDEPTALAGDDAGPSPVEYALAALISCQVVVYRLYAHAHGIRIDDIEIDAEGDLDARRLLGIDREVRAGFSAVRLVVKVTGPESRERYEQLQSVVDAHCPVFDLFQNPVPVSVRLA